jgi:hypothetical protein
MELDQISDNEIIFVKQPDGSRVRITKQQLDDMRAAGWVIGKATRIHADAEAERKILEDAKDLTGGFDIKCSNPNCSDHKH